MCLGSCCATTRTPLHTQWHPVEKPLSGHEGASVPHQTCRRTPLQSALARPPYILRRTMPRDNRSTYPLPFMLAHLLHGHGTRLAPLAASSNARSTKASVFLIHSGVTSFLPTQLVHVHPLMALHPLTYIIEYI
jgi:hypothetical protein